MKAGIMISLCMIGAALRAQIPILNSNPSVTNKVVYLDFDGQVVTGTLWNSGNTINAAASTFASSSASITVIWKRMSEDYYPFDVNITTDSTRFNAAPANQRMRIIFTPTSAWYGSAGGVAYVGSFAWGGTPGTPCWVFENQLGYNTRYMAEAASHEAGHTFTLKHQSTWDANCAKTAEYNPGLGTGITSWAPIMGVGYYKNLTLWHTGTNTYSCNSIQYDHGSTQPGLTSSGYLSFKTDDVGDYTSNGKIMNLNSALTVDSGLISTPADVDLYRFTICNSRYVSINAKPWALDTVGYNGANLDIKLKLYNASTNSVIAADSTISRLYGLVGLILNPGNYYFTIDGDVSQYASDYGSLGRYYLSIKASNPPSMSNSIVIPGSVCNGSSAVLSYTSNGLPSVFSWTISGATNSVLNVPTPTVTFPAAGSYTISLLAFNSSSQSCVVTQTLNVSSLPSVVVTGPTGPFCFPTAVNLIASGANSYTWQPGNYTSSLVSVTPSVSTNYTITGSNGNCKATTTKSVQVSPDFTLAIVNSATQTICPATQVTITINGASIYTIEPGHLLNSGMVIQPGKTESYTVTGTNGFCNKSAVTTISVFPDFQMTASVSSSTPCIGDSIVFNLAGAYFYTVQPGNFTGPLVIDYPVNAQTYTVTGGSHYLCFKDTLITVTPQDCVMEGVHELSKWIEAIYPNPAKEWVNIRVKSPAVQVELLAINGDVIGQWDLTQQESILKLQEFSPGLYTLKLVSKGLPPSYYKLMIE